MPRPDDQDATGAQPAAGSSRAEKIETLIGDVKRIFSSPDGPDRHATRTPASDRSREDETDPHAPAMARADAVAAELRNLKSRVGQDLEALSDMISRRPTNAVMMGAVVAGVAIALAGFVLLAPAVRRTGDAAVQGPAGTAPPGNEEIVLETVLQDVQLLRAELQRLQAGVDALQTANAPSQPPAPADLDARIAEAIAARLAAEPDQGIAQAEDPAQPSPAPEYEDASLRETLCASARMYDDNDPAYANRLREEYC